MILKVLLYFPWLFWLYFLAIIFNYSRRNVSYVLHSKYCFIVLKEKYQFTDINVSYTEMKGRYRRTVLGGKTLGEDTSEDSGCPLQKYYEILGFKKNKLTSG